MLPDDVDAWGNLPELRCGWKRCGREYANRDKLLDHVRRCIPHTFVHRFHVHCRMVLESAPHLSFEAFAERTLALFDDRNKKHVSEKELKAYYQQFREFFKQKK